jgi:hypothetical protein
MTERRNLREGVISGVLDGVKIHLNWNLSMCHAAIWQTLAYNYCEDPGRIKVAVLGK